MPVACGPRIALPPLNTTRSAPVPAIASQIGPRRQLGGSVDQHRQMMCVRTAHDLGQRRSRAGRHHIQHAGSARAKRGGVLPGLDPAHARAGDALVKADFDQPRAGCAHRVVVAVAMFAGDDELIGKAVAARQPFHAAQVVAAPGSPRRPASERRGAGRDQSGFGPVGSAMIRDATPCNRSSGTVSAAACLKRLQHGLGHRRASQPRDRARGVDDRLQAQLFINAQSNRPRA